MRSSEFLNIFYFGLFLLLALIRPLPPKTRIKAVVLGGAGLVLVGAAELVIRLATPQLAAIIRDWLPAALIPLAYWQAGSFFQQPDVRLQDRLEAFDRRIIPRFFLYAERRGATVMEAIFELSYLLCYPLVPAGVAALYLTGAALHAEDYWLLVLPSSYACYGFLPFFQTLPPRAIEPSARTSFNTALRSFNFWILRWVSIQANTFPSAHVAASIASGLALLELAPTFGLVFLILAVAIAVASVLGRYHYALDAVTGAAVAVVVFVLKVWISR